MTFYLSKMIWIFINPFSIIVLLFIVAFFFFLIKQYKLSLALFLIEFILIITFSFFPIGHYLTFILEKEYHENIVLPDDVDGIIILGGTTNPKLSNVYNQINVNEASERLIESIRLIKKYKKAKVIFSGGSGSISKQNLSHAEIAKKFYELTLSSKNNIIFEDKSRNTYENIIFSSNIVKPEQNENWILITSAFHMKRALLIGEKHNWKFIPYPVDFKVAKKISLKPNFNLYNNFSAFQKISHEWTGLVSYYLMDRTNRIF